MSVNETTEIDTVCPACAAPISSEPVPYMGLSDEAIAKLFAGAGVVFCDHCGHGHCHPRIDDVTLRDYYASRYWGGGKNIITTLKLLLRAYLLRVMKSRASRARTVPEFIFSVIQERPKMLLEIGSGNGDCAIFMKRFFGGECYVVEPSSNYDDIYRHFGIIKVARYFDELNRSSLYDLIYSQHWLEHIMDAERTMRKIHDLIKPGGYVFLDVPNCDEEYWKGRVYPEPPHVNFFTVKSMKYLLSRTGFEVIRIGTTGAPTSWEQHESKPWLEAVRHMRNGACEPRVMEQIVNERLAIRNRFLRAHPGERRLMRHDEFVPAGRSNLRVLARRTTRDG